MASTPFIPPAMWLAGTNQNSIPANDNALRFQISQSNVNNATTAQPASPTEGACYIIQSTHTGAQWSGFTPKDLAIFSGGSWYAFAPVAGNRVSVGGAVYIYSGSAWVEVAGGGGGTGIVESIVAGDNITVDDTDPANPIVSATGGGGGSSDRIVNVMLSDLTSVLTTGSTRGFWIATEDGTLTDIWLALGVAQSTSGAVQVDLNNNGTTMLSVRPTINSGSWTSLSSTPPTISSASFVRGDRLTFDIDQAGTDSKGLQAVIEYTAS